jgi:hypothetical protein
MMEAGGFPETSESYNLIKAEASSSETTLQIYQTSSSSSSSIGTTARCGLWPVEKYPSIFSYLSPTLSIFSVLALEDLSPFPSTIVKSIQLFPLFDFRNNKFFLLCGVVSPTPYP